MVRFLVESAGVAMMKGAEITGEQARHRQIGRSTVWLFLAVLTLAGMLFLIDARPADAATNLVVNGDAESGTGSNGGSDSGIHKG